MEYTRRDLGKMALALPAAAIWGRSERLWAAVPQTARPNSLINGVQVGTITYSYRSMPDQSAEATLKYVVASGISAPGTSKSSPFGPSRVTSESAITDSASWIGARCRSANCAMSRAVAGPKPSR